MVDLKNEPVLLLTKRADLTDACKQELKAADFKSDNFKIPESFAECEQILEGMQDGLLILDWDVGVPDVLKILSTNVTKFKVESRPIILIATKADEKIIASASEYGVNQVAIGSVSREKLKTMLAEILAEHESIDPVREGLVSVAKAREEGRWDEATSILEDQIQADPNNMRIRAELAENYMQTGAWEKALDVADRFRNLEVAYPRGLHLLGRCLMRLGRDAEAASILQQAKIISPYNVDRLVDLGNVYLRLDQIKEAEEQFDEAIKFAPGSEAAQKGIGQCKLIEGEINEALKIFREIASEHELASMFNTAAVLSIRHGRYSQGMQLYDAALKAVDRFPKIAARLHFNRGIGHFRQKEWTKALQCFQKAFQLDPSYDDAKKNIAALSQGFAGGDSSSMPSEAGNFASTPTFAPIEQDQKNTQTKESPDSEEQTFIGLDKDHAPKASSSQNYDPSELAEDSIEDDTFSKKSS